MAHAIRFAQRHVERLARSSGQGTGAAEPLGWRFDPEMRSLQLTPGLANLLGLSEAPGLLSVMRRLDADDRSLVRAALKRLDRHQGSTAFAHDLGGVGRVVQHLQFDSKSGSLHALVEALGIAPDASLAVRDALTGARDANSARRWIDRELAEGKSVGAILIGLNRFETVNTAYGREAGDALLRGVSRRVAEVARELLGREAIVARIGGSEFLVASHDAGGTRLAEAEARLEEALSRPFVAGGEIAHLGARMVSVTSVAGDSAGSLLRRASEALLGDAVPAEPNAPPIEELANDLHRALERSEIGVRFQPQVAIASGQVVGVEALARWQHPQLGEIGAETLFMAAERAGLEAQLSDHVQRRALTGASQWPSKLGQLRLSINVTATDVARAGFADNLLGRVDVSGFPRSRLTVEITESGIMADLTEAARLLSQLRAAGCRVAIDDFGTGYSSMAYLKLPAVASLKIDRSFVTGLPGDSNDAAITEAMLAMAKSLGLTTIAEGIETEAQHDFLLRSGCVEGQGYLYSYPLRPEEVQRLLCPNQPPVPARLKLVPPKRS
jgi:diguanylate cyclase (GGDEF)-like protein